MKHGFRFAHRAIFLSSPLCARSMRSVNLVFVRHWVALLLASVLPALGHDVITTKITWSREISRIVYARCLTCHRDGGRAFSLTTYVEARPWAKAIKEEVLA